MWDEPPAASSLSHAGAREISRRSPRSSLPLLGGGLPFYGLAPAVQVSLEGGTLMAQWLGRVTREVSTGPWKNAHTPEGSPAGGEHLTHSSSPHIPHGLGWFLISQSIGFREIGRASCRERV